MKPNSQNQLTAPDTPDSSLQDGTGPAPVAHWMAEHGDVLFAYAVARVRNRADAEDMVQETLLSAMNGWKSFRGDAELRTWLIGILRNKIADFMRSNARKDPSQLEELARATEREQFNPRGAWRYSLRRWPADPQSAMESQEFWRVFDHCLSKLPPKLADAYVLREMDQRDTEEICNLLDITASNLGARLHRARVLLRKCLEENWFNGLE